MITDEQLRIACRAFYGKHIQPDCCCDEKLQVIRRALKAYEQSKWVKYDINDKTTHPKIPDDDVCVTILGVTDLRATSGDVVYVEYYESLEPHVYDPNIHGCNTPFILFNQGYVGEVDYGIVEVSAVHLIAWQPLPEFKE